MGADEHGVEPVRVRWSFHLDGSWSVLVIADDGPAAPATAATGSAAMGEIAADLAVLAERRGCGLDVVHDLEGDPRAFAVVAALEGFAGDVVHHVSVISAAS